MEHRRHLSPLEWMTLGACLVVELHLLVEAATGHDPASSRLIGPVAAAALVAAACAAYLAGGRVLRTALTGVGAIIALSLGIGAYAAGAALAGRAVADVTGTAVGIAGAVMLVVALATALHGRPRLVQVPLVVLVVAVVTQCVVFPAVMTTLATHVAHRSVASARTLGFAEAEDVSFRASDGAPLRGWYVPSRNGAAVVLLHGSHGTREATLPYLRFLANAGYGVLAYDARGHGESGGATNALGWRGGRDVAAAVAFVERRADVDAQRIGLFGLSMGGEEALRAAATGAPVGAVVADGAGASTLGDLRLVSHGALTPIFVSSTWIAMREIELVSGATEPEPLKDVVVRITAPTLLIASNAMDERAIDEAFGTRIGPRASLWYVPDAGHTRAFRVHPNAYRARTLAFLDRALQAPG